MNETEFIRQFHSLHLLSFVETPRKFIIAVNLFIIKFIIILQ